MDSINYVDPSNGVDSIKEDVRRRYAALARQGGGCCGSPAAQGFAQGARASADVGAGCCAPQDVSALVEYGALDASLPAGSNLQLGCGIPTRFAALQPGQTVLDLGCGAGVDVFLAAAAVGPGGRAIGVDMTPEMITRARENARAGGYREVEFRLGEIEALPVATRSVDVVLSNCVINLVPDKRKAFAEIHRVLRPRTGRFVIADIVTRGEMPAAIRASVEQWTGCIAGALDREAYLQLVRAAGFTEVEVLDEATYDAYRSEGFTVLSVTLAARKA
jgi:arsenite methyltransferase